MGNVQGGNENGARAHDEEHGAMRKRTRQRHEKGDRGNKGSATINEQVAMSTEQEATVKEPGQAARGMRQAASGTVLGLTAMGHGISGKRHCFGTNGNGARDKRQAALF